ncbi:hypothetical protein C2G38_1361732 [Gigaspora rosea]|uniref:Uncharacterized protein n=1 Tax=Gigaspora rosea TaxID=44941 RepID=A0A397W215_9GLOM|nr:hypothetical protein C2G38_1361732 [Gigaspora rosea]
MKKLYIYACHRVEIILLTECLGRKLIIDTTVETARETILLLKKNIDKRISEKDEEMQEDYSKIVSEIEECCNEFSDDKIRKTKEDCDNRISETKEDCDKRIRDMKVYCGYSICDMEVSCDNRISEIKENYDSRISETKKDFEKETRANLLLT